MKRIECINKLLELAAILLESGGSGKLALVYLDKIPDRCQGILLLDLMYCA
jgi:hypothetical protein